MSRQIWKPGNMLYPLPAVMVSTADKEGNINQDHNLHEFLQYDLYI